LKVEEIEEFIFPNIVLARDLELLTCLVNSSSSCLFSIIVSILPATMV
jgi:hypothetical protein